VITSSMTLMTGEPNLIKDEYEGLRLNTAVGMGSLMERSPATNLLADDNSLTEQSSSQLQNSSTYGYDNSQESTLIASCKSTWGIWYSEGT